MSLFKRLGGKEHPSIPSQVKGNDAKKTNRNTELEMRLHNYIVEELKNHPDQTEVIDKKRLKEISESFFQFESDYITFEQKTQLIDAVEYELFGYGPITQLLSNPQITEIMVNGPNDVYIERKGKLIKSDVTFHNDQHVLKVIERIVSPLGRRIDESNPMVDARLPDGSRVNAIIPPLALNGPTITIRKFSQKPFGIQELIQFGTLSKEMAKFIESCVKAKLNIFISGGTSSGKTTTLNVLSSFIPNDERIITIEDAAELKLHQQHVVKLESRPSNIEGQGEVKIRDLVRNSLRMRPDRIIVGEVRSAEALDMLQAMNTGHEGSLGTGHANTPRDMLARLETMVLMAGMDLPVRAIREQIAGALDLIIHQSRLKDGSRKITHITEVVGMEGDTIILQDIFLFKEKGQGIDGKVLGEFISTGIRPSCADKLALQGLNFPSEWIKGEW
ncbi:CpaF family protein [Ureibacillus acetophenoni]|uniref:Pilus assembly protein CpaF n=1 Tax=Ureibacillus acetophenoni TaxID=614649 RepID=A0A285U791_9BACL|nr:CpaF family protein [Ureibacillus acetophenoni]SOC37268.1 pilus assembly protein CpaF [Ureibacillus acetophenoni]